MAEEPEVAPAPAGGALKPGEIVIKPTGRRRVSRVGIAPPPPVVDARILAQGDSPKGGGPYFYYPVGYIPTYCHYSYESRSYCDPLAYSRPYCH